MRTALNLIMKMSHFSIFCFGMTLHATLSIGMAQSTSQATSQAVPHDRNLPISDTLLPEHQHIQRSSALPQPLGNLVQWRSEPQGLAQGLWMLLENNIQMRLVVYTPSIVRVRIARDGAFDDHSFAVIATPQPEVRFRVRDTPDALVLTTDTLSITVHKNPVRLQMLTTDGKLLNEDEPSFGTVWQGTHCTVYKRLLPDERFIGLGEKTGRLNRRGSAYTNWNTDAFGYSEGTDPLYGSHPFYIGLHSAQTNPASGLMYGIFFDNPHKSHVNFGASQDRYSSFGAEDGEMNYYFIHRSSIAGILEDYTHLTGHMELPPLWSLGYHQCRYSYFPDAEVLSVARTLRDKKIPADVLWLDIHYMNAYKVFTWHPERFARPRTLLAELDKMGFKTVVITDPGIKVEEGYAAYDDGLRKNIFLKYADGKLYKGEVWPGWCHFPDFTSPAGRAWWGDKLKTLIDDGVDGFWTDMNEPAVWGQHFPHLVMFDFDGQTASHTKGHNVFGMQMARATFEGSRKHLAGKRPFVLTRASYAGIQRYAAVWTGDNTSSDEHLLLGVRLVNAMGLSGIPFAGVDIGGFSGGCSRELFARWISVGAFTPFFRTHAAINTKEQDPWSFGEDIEALCKQYISLRYAMMPYLYSTFYEASKTGLPVARSLAFEHPFDERIYSPQYDAQYLFGRNILVAPVVSHQQYGKVYLPDGVWYDLHNGRCYQGTQEILVETPLERLPLFVKAGALLPMQSPVQSTAQKPLDVLVLHVYYNPRKQASSFEYYEDDGATYGYKQGQFARRILSLDATQRRLRISRQEGKYASHFTSVKLVLHGFDQMTSEQSGMQSLREIRIGNKTVPLVRDSVPCLENVSGFDPLGERKHQIQSAQSFVAVIPFSSDEFVVEW